MSAPAPTVERIYQPDREPQVRALLRLLAARATAEKVRTDAAGDKSPESGARGGRTT
jgi:hypothetical protein